MISRSLRRRSSRHDGLIVWERVPPHNGDVRPDHDGAPTPQPSGRTRRTTGFVARPWPWVGSGRGKTGERPLAASGDRVRSSFAPIQSHVTAERARSHHVLTNYRAAEPADEWIDDRLRTRLAGYGGKWVALAPPSRLLGHGETALEAHAAGQAAGEPRPVIRRIPTW
jgi:hypothetical protein